MVVCAVLTFVLAAATDGTGAQVIQVIGAALVLSAFAAAQAGRLDTTSPVYLALNLVGSFILAVLAALSEQIGFLLLEAVWAAVSLWGLLALRRR